METPTLDTRGARLPGEIWLSIFKDTSILYNAPESDNRWKDKLQFVDLHPITRQSVIISHVCQNWRRLCLSTSSFWSYIAISGHPFVDEMVKRSGDTDLYVSYDTRIGFTFVPPDGPSLHRQRLVSCLPRARILQIDISERVAVYILGKLLAELPCSRLERIYFADRSGSAGETQITVPPTCPNIGSLTLCGTMFDPAALHQSLLSNPDVRMRMTELILHEVATLTPASAIFLILTEIRKTVRRFYYSPRPYTNQSLVPNDRTVPIDLPQCEEIFLQNVLPLDTRRFLSSISTSASIVVETRWSTALEDLIPFNLGRLTAFTSVRSVEFVSGVAGQHDDSIRGFSLTERNRFPRSPTVRMVMPIKRRGRWDFALPLPSPLSIWKLMVTDLSLWLHKSVETQGEMWVSYLSSDGGPSALVSLTMEGVKNTLELFLRALSPLSTDVSSPLPSPNLRILTIRTTEIWDDPNPWTPGPPSDGLLVSVLAMCEARRANRPEILFDQLFLDCPADVLEDPLLRTCLWRTARQVVFLPPIAG